MNHNPFFVKHAALIDLCRISPRISRIVQVLSDSHQPAFQGLKTVKTLYLPHIKTWSDLHHLPVAVRNKLSEEFGDQNIVSLKSVTASESEQCVKYLLSLQDGQTIESVWMRFRDSKHASLCISSQVGCALKCSFCATGAAGFQRQLKADEIVDQVLYSQKSDQLVDTISFMGMGEALQNPNVFTALEHLINPDLFGLSPRRISVSTVGIIPGIVKMTERFPKVNLAFSLHSPFEEQRAKLVPANNHYPLPEVLKVLKRHVQITGRKIFVAYLVLPGINDSDEHAQKIAQIIKGMGTDKGFFHINLLRYNPAMGIEGFSRTSTEDVLAFTEKLEARGLKSITTRQSFGVDINAACGQLHQIRKSRNLLPQMSK